MTEFFEGIPRIRYEGPDSDSEFAYRHYNADEVVLGKPMKDQLRFAVAYWHSFAWEGLDPFGGQTFHPAVASAGQHGERQGQGRRRVRSV